jgi:hypothetical protein
VEPAVEEVSETLPEVVEQVVEEIVAPEVVDAPEASATNWEDAIADQLAQEANVAVEPEFTPVRESEAPALAWSLDQDTVELDNETQMAWKEPSTDTAPIPAVREELPKFIETAEAQPTKAELREAKKQAKAELKAQKKAAKEAIVKEAAAKLKALDATPVAATPAADPAPAKPARASKSAAATAPAAAAPKTAAPKAPRKKKAAEE